MTESLIPKHGGYRRLISFQLARLAYDLTVTFCDHYIDRTSRTRDQMVQAARSGVQNIAEGSQASATSKKTEIKLTQVARASLEELKLDYEDQLRQHDLSIWDRHHPLSQAFIDQRFQSSPQVLTWIKAVSTDFQLTEREALANTILTLIRVSSHLLDKQVAALAKSFEEEGGMTERMYRIRKMRRG
jgi:four helix bundle suffix protein